MKGGEKNMTNLLNTKILLSGATILAAAALVIGATFAFFSDSETSTGNTFAAGDLDLQIDAEAHYAGLTCDGEEWDEDVPDQSTRPDLIGDPCDGTWALTDLDVTHKFFNLTDIKPGDTGENTISIHVFDNDAWVRLIIDNVQDLENDCTENETEANDTTCTTDNGDGELQENLQFAIWLDQGSIDGFQCSDGDETTVDPGAECNDDPEEGDNIRQAGNEPLLVTPGTLDQGGETLNIWEGLAAAWTLNGGDSPGILEDGRVVGSFTYYFGLEWELPDTVGNGVQTDSLVADMTFEAEQHRNNPTPFGP